MSRLPHLGLALLLMLGLAVSGLAQDGPQAQSKAEYDAYSAFYNEQDAGTKANLGEAFLGDFPESEFRTAAFQLLLTAYTGTRDWQKLIETADRFDRDVRDADAQAQAFVFQNAMVAAQQLSDVDKIMEYGGRVLQLDRNNLSVLLTLSQVIPDNLPIQEGPRERLLQQSFDMANRARIQARQFFANKPSQFSDAQWAAERTRVEKSIYATLGRVHMERKAYDRAAAEYRRVLSLEPNDVNAHYQLGLSYEFQAADSSSEVVTAIAAETEAREGDADAASLEGLVAQREGLQDDVLGLMDQAIDSFARAVAIAGAGPGGSAARQRLETLYRNKNEDSLDGLDDLIEAKRSEIGGV